MRVVFILFLLLISCIEVKAFENGSIRKPDSFTSEPIIAIDRTVKYQSLGLNGEYQTDDSSVLVSPKRFVNPDSKLKKSINDLVDSVNALYNDRLNSGMSSQSSIEILSERLNKIEYDSKAKNVISSKNSQEVLNTNKGNCFEVSRLAYEFLIKRHYFARLISIKNVYMVNYHTICAFKELDGSWSYFSATDKYVGYSNVHCKSLKELIQGVLPNVNEVIFLDK